MRTLDLLNTVQALGESASLDPQTAAAFPDLASPTAPSAVEGRDDMQAAAEALARSEAEVRTGPRAKTRWNALAAIARQAPQLPAVTAPIDTASNRLSPLVGDAYYAAKELLIRVRVLPVAHLPPPPSHILYCWTAC